jgi:hypothetical protein
MTVNRALDPQLLIERYISSGHPYSATGPLHIVEELADYELQNRVPDKLQPVVRRADGLSVRYG